MSPRPPRWYFSFSSPYSWLAYRDLTGPYADIAHRIEWLPFWEPDEPSLGRLASCGVRLPYVPMSAEKLRYVEYDVRRLARARGLRLTWPRDRRPRWEVSHLAYLVAEEHGVGPEFAGRVYRARWEEGRDISDPAVIASLGPELGLNPDRLAAAGEDRAVRERGLAALRALHEDGVFGVPYFIDGGEQFWGVDRLPGFAACVRAGLAAGKAG
ncbi:DsbA family protein [Streptomyces sp. B1866]|uniref:2-hydroxychromene-2-carboxylate isomerase n=1 Tax=Streptomyces sp. B1866 TaxID=3075431 RepID=UPI0028925D36|nr:DsbA family protein [Streptomyces sp. B1866]MDT3395958.1 DsbA family protein [Streptomyces sp. B1866]